MTEESWCCCVKTTIKRFKNPHLYSEVARTTSFAYLRHPKRLREGWVAYIQRVSASKQSRLHTAEIILHFQIFNRLCVEVREGNVTSRICQVLQMNQQLVHLAVLWLPSSALWYAVWTHVCHADRPEHSHQKYNFIDYSESPNKFLVSVSLMPP